MFFSLLVWHKVLSHDPSSLGKTKPLVAAPFIPNPDTLTCHLLVGESSRTLLLVFLSCLASIKLNAAQRNTVTSLHPQVHAGSVRASRCAPVYGIPLPAREPSLVNPAWADPEGPARAQSDPRQPEHRRGVRQHQKQH